MSEPEGFLSRWSRRKHAAQTGEGPKSETSDDAPAESESSPDPRTEPATEVADTPEFDLSTLPSLDEITAATDIRAFLAPGVPAELTRAALRRAWAADPHIREFVGIAENQWDFNVPESVPGFGALSVDDVRRLAAGILGEGGEASDQSKRAAQHRPDDRSGELSAGEGTQPSACAPSSAPDGPDYATDDDDVAPQEDVTRPAATQNAGEDESIEARPTVRRSHGGALPQ